MQKLKKLFSKEMLINYVFVFYLLSLVLDFHFFYNSISTLIRVLVISFLFLIIFIFYASPKERKILIAYFLALLLYLILHLININHFNVSFIKEINNLNEILYFFKMSMNVLIIYIIYKLQIDKKKFYNLIYLASFLMAFTIVLANILKVGYTSYDFLHPEYNIFDWFKGSVPFASASTKGYFHLTNQIAAIFILYLPLMLVNLKEKVTIPKVITIILTIMSLFMLGTRVSTYSVFIILIVALIVYLVVVIIREPFSKMYTLSLVLFLILSISLYRVCPLLSRNSYYDTLFSEKETSKEEAEFKELDNVGKKELSDTEFKKYLGYFNIDSDFYNTYYPLENDREFYENYLALGVKINDTRFLERKIIERVEELNNHSSDIIFGIGYDRVMHIFNIESDYVMQYYALGIFGVIILLGVNVFLLILMGFKCLFNLKRYFNYENMMLLFSILYFLVSTYFTGNILNAISTIIPISLVIGYLLSRLNKQEKKEDNEYYLGFKVTTKNKEEILKGIFKEKKLTIIYNINPLIINNFLHNKEIKREINKGKYNIPDGNGIALASRLSSNNIKSPIPGIDLMEDICKESTIKKYTIYLYGAKEESVKGTKEYLEHKYPQIKIIGYQNGYNKNKEEDGKKIVQSKPDILFVALGSPLQEEFIISNQENFKNIKIIMPVGGSFDVLSGNLKRAPKFFRVLKIEWLYRMLKEPKRFKELFGLIKFGFLVLLFNFWYNDK